MTFWSFFQDARTMYEEEYFSEGVDVARPCMGCEEVVSPMLLTDSNVIHPIINIYVFFKAKTLEIEQ